MNKVLGIDISEDDGVSLVQRSRAGDRGAFDSLVRFHQVRAMKTALRVLGDVHEASEAVQDGFVTAYLKIKNLKDPEKFNAWLLRIITNAAIDRQRAVIRRRQRFKSHEDVAELIAKQCDLSETKEIQSAIQSAMGRLSKNQAKAIALFGIEELSHKEVAEILGCSHESARWYVHQGRKKLKVLLKEYLK